jgi:hypothetical protein
MELMAAAAVVALCFFIFGFNRTVPAGSVKNERNRNNVNKGILAEINEYRLRHPSAPEVEMPLIKPSVPDGRGHAPPVSVSSRLNGDEWQLPVQDITDGDITKLQDYFVKNIGEEMEAQRHDGDFFIIDIDREIIIFAGKNIGRTEGNRIFGEIKRIRDSVRRG